MCRPNSSFGGLRLSGFQGGTSPRGLDRESLAGDRKQSEVMRWINTRERPESEDWETSSLARSRGIADAYRSTP